VRGDDTSAYCPAGGRVESHYYTDNRLGALFEEFAMKHITVTVVHGQKISSVFDNGQSEMDTNYHEPVKVFERIMYYDEIRRLDRIWVMK
jgi:hypothetical protein